MADFMKFRTALNGFHRADVTDYIEQAAQEHQQQLDSLRRDLDDARNQLAEANGKLSARTDTEDSLRKELQQTQEALARAQKELEEQTGMSNELLQQLDETETALKATQDALEEALTPEPAPADETEAPEEEAQETPDYAALELEAYRRAEAMERLAGARSARVRLELSELLDQVSARYEQTGQDIQVLTEDIRTNLQRLTEAMSDLDVIFDETTHRFDTLDAGAEEALDQED